MPIIPTTMEAETHFTKSSLQAKFKRTSDAVSTAQPWAQPSVPKRKRARKRKRD